MAELVRRGERVRALTRDPAAAAGRFPAEVELVTGTHTAPERLDAALDDVNRLHITVTAGLAEVGPELVQRAVAAGVRRITVLWGGWVGPVEQAVADSGVEWTRLEAQEFMCNTLAWAESIRAEGWSGSRTTFPVRWCMRPTSRPWRPSRCSTMAMRGVPTTSPDPNR
ncbi:SDR family oxidoreductase [Nonomuraea antimicrobica]